MKHYLAVVGLSVYSGDRLGWLKQSVYSVLNQTFTDYLLVIVIDGDVSEEIRNYLLTTQQQDNVALIQMSQNSGLAACMNVVIEYAAAFQPQYMFRMDADDVCEPERLAKQTQYLNAHPNVDVLGSSLIEIDENGRKVGKRILPLQHNEIVRFLPKRCSVNHPTVAIRYKVFNDGYRYDETLLNTQDYFLWAKLVADGYEFANLPERLLRFRRVNDFYKRRGADKSINEFKARLYTMRVLNRVSLGNLIYAFSVLALRLMPSPIIHLAYKLDRAILSKFVKH